MGSRIYIEDVDLIKAFISSWLMGLEELEKNILKLEIQTDDMELIHSIQHRIHHVHAGASFFGLSGITRVSYGLEQIMDSLRERKLTADADLIDGLLSSLDFIKDNMAKLSQKLTKRNFTEENGHRVLNLKREQNEDTVLEGIRALLQKPQESAATQAQDEEEFGVLESDEFKRGLSESLKEQFILESTEHIETIENDILIRLDNNGDEWEAINEGFRLVHTIKGGAGIYLSTLSPEQPAYGAVKRFSEIVHTFESLFSIIRDKRCSFERNLVDLSLSVMDSLKLYIHAVAAEEFEQLPQEQITDRINESIQHYQTLTGSFTLPTSHPGKEEEKTKGSLTQSIRVNQEKIDTMMNMISELIIAKNTFMHISSKLNTEYNLPEMSKEVKEVGAYVNRISDELQNAIMSIRMVEVKTVFQRMPRVIRDIAQSTGKKIELVIEGETTEIDKTIIEQISDPLIHLIRNAADHGIESPQDRLSKGKDEKGRIVLRAYNKNKYVYIEIEDDGKGIDAEKIKEKAINKGFITESEAEKMTPNQWVNLIFLPGFSTAERITEVSGRGVGMDIVRSNILKIKGNVTIESEAGKGTKIIVQLPLTLAVSRGLIVEASSENYIIPLEYIAQTVKIQRDNIHTFNGKCFTHLRGEIIGVEWLSTIFQLDERDQERNEFNAVIIANGAEKHAMIVDKLKNEQEFVVRTLDGQLAGIPGISGSTLLGNGKVVLIVNPPDLLKLASV